MAEVVPAFWDGLREFIAARCTDADEREVTATYVRAFAAYTRSKELTIPTVAARGRFAEAMKVLTVSWPTVRPHSLLRCVESYGFHFHHRDVIKPFYNTTWDAPADNLFTVHIDFGEHHCLPIGPVDLPGGPGCDGAGHNGYDVIIRLLQQTTLINQNMNDY